jgi:signal transduction histidine kinase
MSLPAAARRREAVAWRLIRESGLRVLVGVLLVPAVVRALLGSVDHAPAVLVAACALAFVYGLEPRVRLTRDRPRRVRWWLAAVVLAWVVLLALTPDGIWLAFPFFFVQLHILPRRWSLPAVAITTVLAIAAFGWHNHTLTVGMVIGPTLGAAVAVAGTFAYQALYRESEQRRRLIEELTATRGELAAAEHAAGVLAERERLAREIHDTLAQGLSSIQLLLRAAERVLPTQPDAALDHVERARQTAADNLAEARRFVRALSPPDLEKGSLPAALERLCASTAKASGLAVHCRLSGPPMELPTTVRGRVGARCPVGAGQYRSARAGRPGRADLELHGDRGRS